MNCGQFWQELNDQLDARRDPSADRRLAQHAQRCPRCRNLLEAQRQLTHLALVDDRAPSSHELEDASGGLVPIPASASWAVAALALLIVIQGARWGVLPIEEAQLPVTSATRDRQEQAAAHNDAPAAPATGHTLPSASISPIVPTDMRGWIPQSLAFSAASASPLTHIARSTVHPDLAWHELVQALSSHTAEPAGWMMEMESQLGPFRRTMGRTWSVLRRTLPGRLDASAAGDSESWPPRSNSALPLS